MKLLIFSMLFIAVGQIQQDHLLTAFILSGIAYFLTNKIK
jgi:uncharacterized MnhB-related membrane protein